MGIDKDELESTAFVSPTTPPQAEAYKSMIWKNKIIHLESGDKWMRPWKNDATGKEFLEIKNINGNHRFIYEDE